MNCNCCNCNSNITDCVDSKRKLINIYGTLVNVTLDTTLDDANCAADNVDYATGHNDALAYAYQLHDGRFRANDNNLPAHERFQDAINRRLTNISYVDGITTIEGDTHIKNLYVWKNGQWVKIDGAGSYNDQWLRSIIGATPSNYQANQALLEGDFDEPSGDIIKYIRLLKQEIETLKTQINSGGGGGHDTNTCYWKIDNDYLVPNCNCRGVKGPGFYDTEVHE